MIQSVTRYLSPATRYPSSATRYPSPATRPRGKVLPSIATYQIIDQLAGCWSQLCSFKTIAGGQCSFERKDRNGDTRVIPLLSCQKDISGHLSTYKFSGPENEVDLILCRAGFPNFTHNTESMTICPSNRSKLGIGWSRGSTIKCRVPQSMSGHGTGKTAKWPKAERGIGKQNLLSFWRRRAYLSKLVQVRAKYSFIIHCTLLNYWVMVYCILQVFL